MFEDVEIKAEANDDYEPMEYNDYGYDDVQVKVRDRYYPFFLFFDRELGSGLRNGYFFFFLRSISQSI